LWLACTLTLDRWVPKWTPFFTLFWALTDRQSRAWKPVPSCLQFDQQRVLSRFFSLLPTAAPLPSSWRDEKPRLRSCELEPNCQTFLVVKKMLYCLNYLKGQEDQLPNIRTRLATILTVPRHLRAVTRSPYTGIGLGKSLPGLLKAC
jgi:hypothetical protein